MRRRWLALAFVGILAGAWILVGLLKRSRMPRDPNQLAKAVVDFATGQREPDPPARQKNAAAVELGRMGGKIGGVARAAKMTDEERRDSARHAAQARWSKAS